MTVTPVTDTPTLTVSNASGNEDSAISLSISGAATDSDGSETSSLSYTISGVPGGATLSAGEDNGDGSWTLTPAQLSGLTITPATDYSGQFDLTVTTRAQDGSDAAVETAVDTITVTVTPVTDTPTLTVSNASGNEDSAISLSISGAATDSDGSETSSLSYTISGVPGGATLSAGEDNGDGSWTLTPAQLSGLTITPATDYSGQFDLTVTTRAQDGSDAAVETAVDTITVTVTPVTDTPTLTVSNASGNEDSAISLSISGAATDSDGSETSSLSYTISGVPGGATLSAGEDNGDGSWTLTPAQLSGLTITPATDYSGQFDLTVTTRAQDGSDAAVETAVDTITVTVTPVTDTPTLTVSNASGNEDSAISLSISGAATDSDGSETSSLSYTISGVPGGATLSAGEDNGDGSWTLTPAQLSGLTITPATDYSGQFDLTVTTRAQDGSDAAVETAVDTITVTVTPVTDTPTLTVSNASGNEDSAISLSISGAATDSDGSETSSLSYTISGVPGGATLSAGEDNGDGSWTLTPAQLSGLTITPATDYSGQFDLTVTTRAQDGSDAAVETAVDTITVTVTPVTDTPTLTVSNASGNEDSAISLSISGAATDSDGSETSSLSYTISGVPGGATLSAGEDNGDGSWTLTPAQLSGLTITPATDYSGQFDLTVTTRAQDGSDAAVETAVDTITVTVTPVTDTPTLTVSNASGNEDSAISLSISGAATDSDGSETSSLSYTISGVPGGATLSAGEDNGDGSWTLTPAQLSGLTITPATDYSGQFDLTVTTRAQDGSDAAVETAVDTITVTVTPVTDTPTLTVSNASGNEDSAISLSISGAATDSDGSETSSLSYTISGVPGGATLSAGEDNGDGSWTLTPAQLSGLTITPATDYSGQFDLTVTTRAQDGSDAAVETAVDTITVTVTPVTDTPTLTVSNASGNEDSAISLSISGAATDSDGSETSSLSYTISGVPGGATLSAGEDNGDGSWTLTPAQLSGLTITPATDYSGQFDLTVTTRAQDGSDAAVETAVDTITVTVTPVTDTPTLTVSNASGNEDSAISLSISGAATDSDGSETSSLSYTISGVPGGATLSAGEDNGDGSWTLTPAQLSGLTITPATDYSGQFDLTVTTRAQDGSDAAVETAVDTITVTVTPVTDTPTLTVSNASGNEDSAISLSISGAATDSDGSETSSLSYTISGVPGGATLSAGEDNGDGSWTLTPAQLSGLTITPATDYSGQFDLTVTTRAQDGSDAAVETAVDTITVTVTPVTDTPTLTVSNASGNEDSAISLSISGAATDSDGSETSSLSYTISGVPGGATLSAGEDNGDGSWTLTPAQLSGLTITPATDYSGQFDLTVTTRAQDGSDAAVETAVDTITVTVTPVTDTPTLTVSNASGNEDSAISLSISGAATDSDGSETSSLSYTISGVPGGATLSAGEDNGDGSWTLTPAQLSGLTITPATDYSGQFDLTVTTRAQDGSDAAVETAVDTITVTVTPVTDTPTLTVSNASGNEDSAISLSISGAATDSDGSETSSLSYTISGVPGGATLSAGEDNGDGSWTLTPAQLSGLTITPATDYSGQFDLTVTTRAQDGSDAAVETAVDTITVTVTPVTDTPTLTVSNASGNEDSAISLSISGAATDSDGSETSSLSYTISGVPGGATLSAGEDNGDGSWTLTPAQLSGLTITPATDYSGQFDLTVTTRAQDGSDAAVETAVDTITVTVTPVTDTPTLTVSNASGNEDSAISLSISGAATDSDGSETSSLSYTISGVPGGATLSAGEDNGDGSWTLTPAQLSGLTITPATDYSGQFDLTVTTRAQDGSDAAVETAVDTITVTVTPVTDTPTLTVSNASGNEDSAISLSISGAATDSDGSETSSLSYTISGVPGGATLSAGEDNGDGSWTLTPAQLSGLTITPATDYSGQFDLTVTTRAQDGSDAAVETAVDTITVTVTPVTDTPTLTVSNASGNEDSAISLSISGAATDSDGSETSSLSYTISGVPGGATLSAGEDNGDGSWTLTPAQLSGLTITPATDYSGQFDLTVTTRAQDGSDAAVETAVDTITVTVTPVTDTPTLTVSNASGNEDSAISLSISGAATDSDGSETSSLSYTISGVPGGATLSAGEDNGDGSWTLTPAQLSGLTITPATDYSGQFDLTVTTRAQDGSDAAVETAVDTITVTVTPVTDTPTLTVSNASGNEDSAISLSISGAATDSDGSETSSLSYTISGVPGGATLSAGEDNGDGSWTLTPAQLSGLTITPATDYSGQFDLTVTTRAQDGSDAAVETAVDTITVTVTPVTDTPTLTVSNASGNEDSAISLSISGAATDSDGSETSSLSYTISGVPGGATLSAGEDNGDGSWTLTPAQLSGLTITPATDYSGQFDLTVTTRAQDGSDAAVETAVDTITVTVTPVTDTPTLTVSNASGNEDSAISLSISGAATDSDGSETSSLSYTISGVPGGATLSAGEDNGDGSWTLTPAQLSGLTITPATDYSGQFDLTVTTRAQDGSDAAVETAVDTITVTVTPVTDTPTLTVSNASGNEDSAISLSISGAATDSDGSETSSLSYTISGVPGGATLSAGEDNGDGSWTLTPAQLSGLTITPATDYSGQFDLTVTTRAQDGSDAAVETAVDTITVTVTPVTDTPTLTVSNASGNEDSAISLSISGAATDSDGSETSSLSYTISGVPGGATLSAGEDNGDGSWTLTPAQLSGLTITPATDYSGQFDLTVTTRAQDGSDAAVETAVDTITVTVTPVTDTPTLTVSNASGNEDSAISLSISGAATDSDGSETSSLSYTISGVPGGATLSAGEDNGDGSWTLTPAQLSGLTITPATDYSGQFDLTVTTRAQDGSDAAVETAVDTITVTVTPVTDTPTLTVSNASGNEDSAISLSISGAESDADGSETLSNYTLDLSGAPSGTTLSAGTNNGDGTWTLTSAQLSGLTISAPADYSGSFDVDVSLSSTDGAADAATTTDTITVTVAPVSDAPTLTVSDASGNEDSAISLSISGAESDADGSETLSNYTLDLSGAPSGTTLSAGTNNGDGTWTLTSAQLSGLTISAPADYSGSFDVDVSLSSTDGAADAATTTDTITVTVAPANSSPVFANDEAQTVSEEGLSAANADATGDPDTTNSATASGSLDVSDPDGDSLTYSLSSAATLSSRGEQITWTNDSSSTLMGSTVSSGEVVRVTVDSGGNYTVTLNGPVDHSDTSTEDTLVFNVTVRAEDGNGLSDEAVIAITVEDDAPILEEVTNLVLRDPTQTSFGVLDFQLGADERIVFTSSSNPFASLSFTGSVAGIAISAPSVSWASGDASGSTWDLSFNYSLEDGSQPNVATGNLSFDYTTDQYSFVLDEPLTRIV